jgi:signal transduction histidine kinase
VGVLLPVLLSTASGIVAIVVGESSGTLILGILVVSFTAAAIGGAVILYVLLGRRVRLARLQSDLLANVTHELRTPLTVIRIHAQNLEEGLLQEDSDQARASLATIVRETEWLETMIDRLLAWRAASRDRDHLEAAPAPLGPVLDRTAAHFRRMIRPDETEFDCHVQTRLTVHHDPRAVEQAVLNLLVNAHKYSPPPRRIRLEARDLEGEVAVTVTDNGIGVPASEHQAIFEPFHRAPSAAAFAAGAGLGLAVVRHLVAAHDGGITLESAPGKGSRFTIHLPAAAGGEGG